MLEHGYGGRVLRVDLTERRAEIERLERSWIENAIGGRGANSKRLSEELNPECSPLGPENLLVFGVGPLTGTLLPASAYFTVSAKSPLTDILGDSAAGGHFGAEMKQTGFDQFVITGSSSKPVYLLVTDEGASFVDCGELIGKTILQTTAAIRAAHRDHSIQVAAIGPAGENLVLFSSIVSSGNRVCGRTGMGAVMGSKNLKAVAVRGRRPVSVASPLAFERRAGEIRRAILAHEEYDKRYALGTTMLMSDLHGIGILPTKHFQAGVCDYLDEISGERLAAAYKKKNKACFNCNLHCSRYYACGEVEAEGPEFETLCSFTSRIGSSNLNFALEMNRFLNQMGMDSLSTGEVVGWLMECRDKGLVKPEDLDGLSVSWGDTDAVRRIVEMIAFGRGIGRELGRGATKFSKAFSKEAQELVMQVKGLDIICGDPRGIKAYGLTYAVASRGADHLRAEPYFELTDRREAALERFGTEKAADRLSEEGKAALVTSSEKIALLTDSMTMCKNIGLCMDILNLKNASELLSAGTGLEFEPESLEEKLALGVERERELNRRFGVGPEADTLPKRFLEEPLTEGPTKGSVVDIEKMVGEYNALHKKSNF